MDDLPSESSFFCLECPYEVQTKKHDLLAFDLNAMAIEGGTPTEKLQTTLDSDSTAFSLCKSRRYRSGFRVPVYSLFCNLSRTFMCNVSENWRVTIASKLVRLKC